MAPCTVSSASAAFMWCLLTVQRTKPLKASFQSSSSVDARRSCPLPQAIEVASPALAPCVEESWTDAKRSPFQLYPMSRGYYTPRETR